MWKKVGLWIDHKRAMIVILSEAGEEVREVESNLARHSRYHGATHPKSPYSAQYQKGDDQLDRQVEEQLGKYYANVIAHLRGAQALLIFGPGEAERELEKRLTQSQPEAPRHRDAARRQDDRPADQRPCAQALQGDDRAARPLTIVPLPV